MARIKPLLFSLAAMFFLSCAPKETRVLLQPSEALANVLAEETARLAGPKKQVAVISPDAHWGTVSTVEQAFRNILKKQGFTVVTAKAANVGDPMRRGRLGLKPGDFIDALEQSTNAGAIVSFAGAPMLSSADTARILSGHPPVLVVATASLGNVPGLWGDPTHLAVLLDNQTLALAIVDGAGPAAQPSDKSDAPHALFAQNYHILTRQN
ncbi:MAG TPA: hypothetical protein VN578_04975 [Candidatus Binatia bacterium]|jgi:hypothetical protein|nr:hypothetical protein [Candidatus Binatia bacterium]